MRLDGEELSSPPSRLLLTSAPSPCSPSTSLQSVDGRAREQASASDRAGQDIVAEAIDHVSDNTIAGDSFLRLEATYFNALGQNLIFALELSLI
jgi:hypothetical protein